MTKAQVLRFTKPSQLFTQVDYKQEYKKFAKMNHPDVGGDAEVMAHINKLYDMACKLDEAGSWDSFDTVIINGIKYPFDNVSDFELGHIYVSDTKLIYHILAKHLPLVLQEVVHFKDDKMKVLGLVPKKMEVVIDPTSKDAYYIIEKPADSFLLKDILTKFGTIDPKHIAWIMSRLYNIGCLIQYNELVHLDISLNSVIIDPASHWVGLYGGWWYSYREGSKITKLPASTYKVLPYSSIASKEASFGLMNVQIRALARELLGARYGDNQKFPTIEPKFVNYITGAGTDSVIDDFIQWDTSIINLIFGPRKFIKWELKKDQIYG